MALPVGAVAVPGLFVVEVEPGSSVRGVQRRLDRAGVDVEDTFTHALRAVLVDVDGGDERALTMVPGVSAVWPVHEIPPLQTQPTVTQTSAPWGLDRIDQPALPLTTLFRYDTTGQGVTVYVVDSGVRADHTQFGGRVVGGVDYTGAGNPGGDCSGHGTHVAGTVAGTTYGVAKNATIVPIRVFPCSGSTSSATVIAGIDWAVAHHTTAPAVMNLSLGGQASSLIDAAVVRAVQDGIVVVAAAGNDYGADACTRSPARAPRAITVGALTSTDAVADFSNVGPCIDVWAPGHSIVSAGIQSTTGTAVMNGTSMAAPHVAGVAARLLERAPALAPDDVAAWIVADAATVQGRAVLQSPLYGTRSFTGPPTTSLPTTTTVPATTTTVPATTTTVPATTTTVPATTTTVPATTTTVPATTTTSTAPPTTAPPTTAPPTPTPQAGLVTPGGPISVVDGRVVRLPGPARGTDGAPITASSRTASGDGAWTADAAGRVYATGDATDVGDLARLGIRPNRPINGMAPTPTGSGYWLVASDGGIFAFGDARFRGSMGGTALNRPIVGMTPTTSGRGYWMVASDGGIFAFGDARFFGSTGSTPLNRPINGMAATPSGRGYWLFASDGGIFAFGDAGFHGSLPGVPGAAGRTAVGMIPTASGSGYWIVTDDDRVWPFGDAR